MEREEGGRREGERRRERRKERGREEGEGEERGKEEERERYEAKSPLALLCSSLVPRLSLHALFHTAGDRKLDGAWE